VLVDIAGMPAKDIVADSCEVPCTRDHITGVFASTAPGISRWGATTSRAVGIGVAV
jgi:hypothetical protein